jgi:hypothetical protein
METVAFAHRLWRVPEDKKQTEESKNYGVRGLSVKNTNNLSQNSFRRESGGSHDL